MTTRFPMPLKDFLESPEPFLKRGDIVLIRRNDSWLSRVIARVMGGTFSHCALMFLVPQADAGFASAFILESTTSGVGVANLAALTHPRTGVCDAAIKRYEAPWFDETAQREVRGRLLDHVQAEYDYGTAFRLFLRSIHTRLFGIQEKLAGRKLNRRLFTKRRQPKQFICGGFIQYGFLDVAARRNIDDDDVIFSEMLRSRRSDEAIFATTPEDLALSPRLEWKYVIRKGRVHEVASYEEAKARLA